MHVPAAADVAWHITLVCQFLAASIRPMGHNPTRTRIDLNRHGGKSTDVSWLEHFGQNEARSARQPAITQWWLILQPLVAL